VKLGVATIELVMLANDAAKGLALDFIRFGFRFLEQIHMRRIVFQNSWANYKPQACLQSAILRSIDLH